MIAVGMVAGVIAAGTTRTEAATRRTPARPSVPAGITSPAQASGAAGSTNPIAPIIQEDLETRARARFISPELQDATIDPDQYRLGPGDLLGFVLVVGETRTEQLPVLPEGVVMVPNVGSVPAAGRTLTEFRAALNTAVSKRYRGFELYCYLTRPRQFRVWVTGEVRDPGAVAARAYERVADVLDRAGGLTDRASRRAVELCDAQGVVLDRVDLDAFLVRGDARANPRVSDGQIVHVPARTHSVDVSGEVASPGAYESRPGELLSDFLALAGGPLTTADLSRVSVERTDSTGAVRVETYDVARDAPNTDNATRVTVLSTQLGRARVFVIGPDGVETVLFIAPNESLADHVRRSATMGPEADVQNAQFTSRNAKGESERRSIDIGRVLRGEQSVALQDGDVLSVPPVKEYIYVSGFVMRPGRYAYRGDWTVNDYVGEAGGPTAGGSLDHVVLLGAGGKKRDGSRRSAVQRGETIFLDRSFTGKASGALGLVANLSALIISVVALRR